MWRSLSFILYVGSISALDFPQIGFCVVLAPKGPAGGWWTTWEESLLERALENVVLSLEITARACSEPHVRSKSQLRLVLEPTRLGPLAADMSLYVI